MRDIRGHGDFPLDWRGVAVVASAGAAGIHFGAARAHLAEFAPAGAFMLIAGVAQLVWAVWVARGASERILEAGMAGNAGIVALWVASRTIGLPVGAMPGIPEHIHGTDLLATGLEILIVVAVLGAERVPRPPVWVLALTALGVVFTLVAGGDDPSHERLVAAATLVLTGSTVALAGALTRTFDSYPGRRSHAHTSIPRRAALGFGSPARADSGAR